MEWQQFIGGFENFCVKNLSVLTKTIFGGPACCVHTIYQSSNELAFLKRINYCDFFGQKRMLLRRSD